MNPPNATPKSNSSFRSPELPATTAPDPAVPV
jgi:hypothetical protein